MPRRERLVPFGLSFGLLLILFHGALRDGFDNDGLGYVAAVTYSFSEHPWFPFVTGADTGHPLLTLWPVGLAWRLLGFSTWSAHLAVFLGAALALVLAGELALTLLPARAPERTRKAVALLAPLVVLAHPLFAGYTVQYLTEVPVTAITLALVIAVAREDRRGAALWGWLVTFTKLTGFVTVAACGAAALLRGLRRREPGRELVPALAPHAASLGALGVFMALKLVVLKLPLTTFRNNDSWYGPAALLTERLPLTFRSITGYPPWATGPWLAVLGAAGVVALFRARRAPEDAETRRGTWTGLELGLLLGAVAAANVLIHAANGNFPQPRYLLPVQALVLVSGVVALALLLGERGRPVFVLLTTAWIGLALLRWRSDTLRPLESSWPRLVAALRMPFVEMSLDVRQKVAFVKRLSVEVAERTPVPCVHGLYATSDALHAPYGGYGPGRRNPGMLHWLPTYAAFRAASDGKARRGECPGGRFIVIASWDVFAERYRELARADPEARLLRTETPLPGTWADVYELTSPPAAPAAASPGSTR